MKHLTQSLSDHSYSALSQIHAALASIANVSIIIWLRLSDYQCDPLCPLQDCIGPSMRECINKTNDFVTMNPRDQVSMIIKPETLESFGK
jgi:hypothetical protein